MNTFRHTIQEQLMTSQASNRQQLPVQLWAMDESRFGLQAIKRRRLTLKGVKPVGRYQHRYQNFWLYGIVAPQTGQALFATQRKLDAATFERFLTDFATTYPGSFHIVLLDNAPAHRASSLRVPANVALLFLPPYAPELNPCERIWQALKDRIAWLHFDDLLALQDELAVRLERYDDAAIRSLTAYPYLIDALHALAA